MLVDCHCHLSFPEFEKDRDEVVKRAGDMIVINSEVDPDSFNLGLSLSEKYENVYCTLGLSASELDGEKFRRAVRLIEEKKDAIVGLGEVGLDHYWVKDEAGREVEAAHFRQMVDLSKNLKLPLVVHSRDAEEEVLNILCEKGVNALLHCFSGSLELALRAARMGCLISIPTNVVNSKRRQELVGALPLEAIVLESDAPFLPPHKGLRNEPSNLVHSLGKIASIKGAIKSEVEAKTTENALRFFGLDNG